MTPPEINAPVSDVSGCVQSYAQCCNLSDGDSISTKGTNQEMQHGLSTHTLKTWSRNVRHVRLVYTWTISGLVLSAWNTNVQITWTTGVSLVHIFSMPQIKFEKIDLPWETVHPGLSLDYAKMVTQWSEFCRDFQSQFRKAAKWLSICFSVVKAYKVVQPQGSFRIQ